MDNSLKKGRITNFSNKIGLFDPEKQTFINGSGDVVLSFPFKDCILEGGMSDEEPGREEKFFHETLDRADIDTLRDPKVLTKFEKIDKDGIHTISNPDEVDFWDDDGELKENLLIKGNNLIALYSLRQKLAGKVKLIYIDPPYNTGSDGFRYNDNFNHSTWLVFMRNRLEVARELLRDDGVIFVQCDDNEQAYLKVLMDEIYGRENFVSMISVKRSFASGLKATHENSTIFKICGYILVYSLDVTKFIIADLNYLKSKKNGYDVNTRRDRVLLNPGDNVENWKFKTVRTLYQKEVGDNKYEKINEFVSQYTSRMYTFIENESSRKYWNDLPNSDKSKFKDTVRLLNKENTKYKYAFNEAILLPYYSEQNDGNLWLDFYGIGRTAESEGEVVFKNGKKTESLLERIIGFITKEGDIILDYHLGSGTTAAVAHKMRRRWVGIEQMDYIEDIAKVRLQKVVEGEQGGISKSMEWQGGGNFVYIELKAYNIEFIERIESARTKEELHTVYVEMASNAFLQFWFDRRDWEKDENYKSLPLEEQKKKLRELLDLNQLYLNLGDMNDSRHHVSALEKALTEKFYGKE